MKKQEKMKQREKIQEMYQAGKSIETIAEELNLRVKQVAGTLVYLGIYKKPISEREKVIKELREIGLTTDFRRIPTSFLKELLDFLNNKK